MYKYKDRNEVRAVIEDLGLYPAYESGRLAPDLMPDNDLRQITESMDAAFTYAEIFVSLLWVELGLSPERDFIRGAMGNE